MENWRNSRRPNWYDKLAWNGPLRAQLRPSSIIGLRTRLIQDGNYLSATLGVLLDYLPGCNGRTRPDHSPCIRIYTCCKAFERECIQFCEDDEDTGLSHVALEIFVDSQVLPDVFARFTYSLI